jgi:hypothetical protein
MFHAQALKKILSESLWLNLTELDGCCHQKDRVWFLCKLAEAREGNHGPFKRFVRVTVAARRVNARP